MLGAVMLTLHLPAELQMAGVTPAIDFKTGRRRRRTRLLVRWTHNSKMLIIGSLKYYEVLCICNWDSSSCVIKVLMHTFGEGRKSGQKYFSCTLSDLLCYSIVYSASFSARVRCRRENSIYSSLNNDTSMYLFFSSNETEPQRKHNSNKLTIFSFLKKTQGT